MKILEIKKTDKNALRNFGLLFAVPWSLIGIILLWKGNPGGTALFIVAVLSVATGLIYPKILRPIYIGWMALAQILGLILTYFILTIFYFVVITPVGLVMRQLGKDTLSRRFPGYRESYWVDSRLYPDDPERYSKPF